MDEKNNMEIMAEIARFTHKAHKYGWAAHRFAWKLDQWSAKGLDRGPGTYHRKLAKVLDNLQCEHLRAQNNLENRVGIPKYRLEMGLN